MYFFCPNGHHSCDCREPPPSEAAMQLQEPPSPLHELGGCKGVWIYVCYQHKVSYGCCRSPKQLSDNITDTSHLVNDVQKFEKPFTDDKSTVRIYCKAETEFSLTIRLGHVILAPTNPNDPRQHWIKDETFGINVKDEEGQSSFALVNKATGQAMKHSIGVKYPVQLTEYNPDKLEKSVLWSLSKKIIRPIGNFDLHLDAEKGIKEYGGVIDGTKIILWDWNDGDNQKWTIISYCKLLS